MKRLIPFLLCVILLTGCVKTAQNTYRGDFFSAALPETFEPVGNSSVLCFAPYGDPLLSSLITFSATEQNWYFDSFTEQEYEEALKQLCGYEALTVVGFDQCSVGGYDAHRIACKVSIDQGTHDLILYTVNADRTYLFTLLNREGDNYISAFDTMLSSVRFTEEK